MSNYAVANKTIVPVRDNPDEKSTYIDELLLGMVVEVLWEDKNDFLYIETKYNYRGYVKKTNLLLDSEKVNNWIGKNNIVVIGSYVDITKEITYTSKIIISVVRGSYLINCYDKLANRTKVMLPNGEIGWIRNENISDRKKLDYIKEEDLIRNNIVETALMYLGTQFRWGGKSSLGIDSSGFACMVYLMNEMVIWRDSDFREKYLQEIDVKDLLKGDLIFFPEHTAIYIGNDKFIHSSGSDSCVVISSLNPKDTEYRETFSATILKFASYLKKIQNK